MAKSNKKTSQKEINRKRPDKVRKELDQVQEVFPSDHPLILAGFLHWTHVNQMTQWTYETLQNNLRTDAIPHTSYSGDYWFHRDTFVPWWIHHSRHTQNEDDQGSDSKDET